MGCSKYLLQGIANDCLASVGGVAEVYLAKRDEIASVAVNSAYTTDDQKVVSIITGITLTTGATGFVKYWVRKNSSSMTSTLNVGDNSSYYSTELSLTFSRMNAAKRMEMLAMAFEDLVAIVKDANGEYYYLGFDNPVSASAETGETGQNRSDANQYTVTLMDESTELPHFILASVVESLVD